ncbi:SDR family oxidoreductase [Methylobacterium sp. Leaf108]|uniref:SDR family oxidoreductase n=1 Tax=Methylobacterium sp. Leaf108 TaxID=1736256 RepID=UPI000B1BC388|nr:SDR family oxidoreductase [Methylobacterium sp. Leaf108]
MEYGPDLNTERPTMNALKPLCDQVIVITGASSGIGLVTARLAAARGARVVLVARNAETLDILRNEILDAGGQAIAVPADVGVREEVEVVAECAIEAYGRIDTWVNNAGLTIYGRLWQVSDADHERLLRTNLWGTVLGSLIAVEHLRRAGGALINVGSLGSDLAFPLQGMYGASKHAVKGFTDSLRMELLEDGAPISVTLIKPASIDTPLPQHARNYMDREPKLPPPVYPPEEVAEAILHAAVHPRRDVFVGGAAKALASFKTFAPGAYDALSPAVSALQRRKEAPRDPAGSLHAAGTDGRARGDHPGYVMRTSAYTRVERNLVPALGLAGVLAVVALLAARSGRPAKGRRS